MKTLKIILMCFVLFSAIAVGNAWSVVTLPTVNISGNAATTAGVGTGEFYLTTGFISQANYLDGSSTVLNNAVESIIYKPVYITGATRTGDYTFTNAVITISDGTFNYLSATLSNITFVTGGTCGTKWCLNKDLDSTNPSTLNLTNVVLSTDATHPSKFIDDLQSKIDAGTPIGMKMILTILSGVIEGDSSSDIFEGVIDGVPNTVEGPAGARTIGYWKNHDEEREFFIADAVALSSVFDTDSALRYSLTKKGKKSMEEKAKQQLAALLLNVASSLSASTSLSTGELEIYNLIIVTSVTEATVGDAVALIEDVINSGDDLNMENAKDLADEINNRDHK